MSVTLIRVRDNNHDLTSRMGDLGTIFCYTAYRLMMVHPASYLNEQGGNPWSHNTEINYYQYRPRRLLVAVKLMQVSNSQGNV